MPLKIAVYLSRHGYGHLVRTAEVCRVLARRRAVSFDLISDLPAHLWPQSLAPLTTRHQVSCDAGVVQSDDFTVDLAATDARIQQWSDDYAESLEREVSRLRQGFDLVFADIPPLAFEAASATGVPSLGMANFSWDWIYREMGFDDAAAQAAASYEKADLLLALTPEAPMPAFRRRRQIGLLGRPATQLRQLTRARLGLRLEQRAVLIALRDGGSSLVQLPPPELDLVWVFASAPAGCESRGDILVAPSDVEWPELVAACDAVVSKPGYGILGDTAANGTPFLYARRQGFPEDPILERWLQGQATAAEIDAGSLREGNWLDSLCGLLRVERPDPIAVPAAEAAADIIESMVGS